MNLPRKKISAKISIKNPSAAETSSEKLILKFESVIVSSITVTSSSFDTFLLISLNTFAEAIKEQLAPFGPKVSKEYKRQVADLAVCVKHFLATVSTGQKRETIFKKQKELSVNYFRIY